MVDVEMGSKFWDAIVCTGCWVLGSKGDNKVISGRETTYIRVSFLDRLMAQSWVNLSEIIKHIKPIRQLGLVLNARSH